MSASTRTLPAFGKHCPRCDQRTVVVRTPPRWRPAKWILLDHFSYRSCPDCHWRGGSVHLERSGSLRGAQRRKAAFNSVRATIQILLGLMLLVLPLAILVFWLF
ncbi:MAG TPA: hypothetical protein VFE05_19970 [Longimicrobiaceae bacterium]|nr:hypothetical protein [Longimicrobiaceae bacterium]